MNHRLPILLPGLLLAGSLAVAISAALSRPDASFIPPRPLRPDPPLVSKAPAPGPRHAEPPAPVRPLPRADDDEAVRAALARVPGGEPLARLLAADALVRRFVAAVDQATGPRLPARVYPVLPLGGEALVAGDLQKLTLTAQHFARYEPLVRAFESLEPKSAAALYARLYPLFEQAYRDLGRRDAFNDRVVDAIDEMLAAPEPQAPLAVVHVGGVFRFADPALEARSGVQKLMLRMGPANAARVKARLKELRRVVARPATPR